MKKRGILNSDISRVLSYMGHTDQICISDRGLPIPDHVERIDVSLKANFPSFIDVLKVLLDDMVIEKVYLAKEILTHNVNVYQEITKLIDKEMIVFVSHEEFKKQTNNVKAIIRTGEQTPYANIILQSNVNF